MQIQSLLLGRTKSCRSSFSRCLLGLAYGDAAQVEEGPLEVTISIEKMPPKLKLVRDLPR